MRCTGCNKKIKQTQISGTWYHKKTANVYCYPKAVATPKFKDDENNWVRG